MGPREILGNVGGDSFVGSGSIDLRSTACFTAQKRAVTNMGVKRGRTSEWPHQGRYEHKLHAVCDSQGRLLNLFVAVG